ncbi:MAG TPA: catalase [Thermoleophilia bacterium]|nr:catalase [Thermoleophilia bacterium]HQG54872.1 catalase [Thermoleophilia bacterium]HQJ97891.1 catalase [Thermoleophilia bacterium]
MDRRPKLTTEAGAPVADNQHSQTAGPSGPVLIQDHHLIEKLAHFNRERIPERVVHARGSGAYGVFEVTEDMTPYTRARFLSEVGKKTEVFVRFSTVAGGRGSADAVRDPRGFAVKFYTEDGNYDLVGNDTPIFFIRDPLKFPDFIHSQKPDPYTNRQEPDNVWDFFSLSPEATHMFTWLFGDRGIPASYRHMDGFGSHTFQWTNAAGEQFFVKYHFKTDQGIRCLTAEEAAKLAGENPDSHQMDLLQAIERGDYPSWTLKVQIMPAAEAKTYRLNPFDLTKVWPHGDYPLQVVGKLTLDRNPENYFADVEQAAFDPAHFVPGIGPSPDKMLQGRLFAYGDAHRYRLGANHTQLPVNRPRAATVANYHRDGFMRADGNFGRARNYEPNSFGGPAETGEPLYAGLATDGPSGTYEWDSREGDDFVQAGALYRVMDEAARARLVNNIAASLSQVSRDDIIARSIAHFEKADPEYGARVREAVAKRRP